MRWTFKPRPLPTLIALAVFCLLMSLGFWQLDRAEQKRVLAERYQARLAQPPLDLAAAGAEKHRREQMHWRRVILRGRFDGGITYLLDNQTRSGRAGHYVYTRFTLSGGDQVLVNRGWAPQPPDRSQPPALPAPEQEGSLSGVIKPPPRVVLLGENTAERLGDDIVRVQELNIADIAAANDWPLLPYVARLDPPAPDTLLRVWRPPGFGRERHLGYAFQWFALAGALLLIYFFVTLERRTENGRPQ